MDRRAQVQRTDTGHYSDRGPEIIKRILRHLGGVCRPLESLHGRVALGALRRPAPDLQTEVVVRDFVACRPS